ncbi:MAG: PEP-CTERM sorting domain-containing protein [Verrucomicrobiaceae bacterium]|nr:PEP-CTERM sorting domain-containing protein [Verrucomicrobiaceae bacterium]
MLIRSKNLLTMLAVAGMTALASQASAATYVAGDLILGFRATGGTGASSNLLVNLGQADTVFRDATSNLLNFVDIGTLLTSTYGSDWNTRSDLFWGVAGVRSNSNIAGAVDGDPTRTNYLSAEQTTVSPGTQQSTAWTIGTSTARADVAARIISMAGVFDAAAPEASLTNVLDASNGNSWSAYNDGATSFTLSGIIEGDFGSGTSGTALDLYRILDRTTGANPTGTVGVGSYEGTFTISDAGQVSFAVTAAVPEPSRALLGGLGLAGVLFRRRRVKATA